MKKWVLAVTVGLAATSVALAAENANQTAGQPVRDTFEQVCSACHSPDVVMDKRLDRKGWEVVVRTMVGRGATASDAEAEAIIDYLATTYPRKPAAGENPATTVSGSNSQ